jgi:hypothetical protein
MQVHPRRAGLPFLIVIGILLAFPVMASSQYERGGLRRLLGLLAIAFGSLAVLSIALADNYERSGVIELLLGSLLWTAPLVATTITTVVVKKHMTSASGRLAIAYVVLLAGTALGVYSILLLCAGTSFDYCTMP